MIVYTSIIFKKWIHSLGIAKRKREWLMQLAVNPLRLLKEVKWEVVYISPSFERA
jgi:hypothetical protein